MVVVGGPVGSLSIGTWIKLNDQITNGIEIQENETMAAKAILICRPNSHHFQERTLTLDQPVKVGRSVARAKPTPTNAIFDCKVLSRYHALLWYENGKFFLQDTKSSNGTFVNNNRLSTKNHEVSSGDIVQFGVDVVENNRKVTHGCIIATLRLFLPDGKEAKASPIITDGDRHGVVPLDDLYKLNQIIQEANQREQCLESKLNALQHVVEETRKSAEESWQAYVGEERLLSRLGALETQLQQARANWSDDRLKEEIVKLRESNEQYQEAAKRALEKVHAEKLETISLTWDLEGAKISAEHDAMLAKEQLVQAELELQEIAQKLTKIQTKADEEKREHERQIRELEQQIEEEEAKVIELELKLENSKKFEHGDHIEHRQDLNFENDLKTKEEILAQNEIIEPMINNSNSNGLDQNHINLTVAPVEEECEKEKIEDLECETATKKDEELCEEKAKEEIKRVSFKLPEETEQENKESENPESAQPDDSSDADNFSSDHVDSKTLKYQYQSAQREQNELRRKLEILEKSSEANKTKIVELEKSLSEEKELSGLRLAENEALREELLVLEQKWKDSFDKNEQLKEKVDFLLKELDEQKLKFSNEREVSEKQVAKEIGAAKHKDCKDSYEEDMKETNKIEDVTESDLTEPNQHLSISNTSNTSTMSCEELLNLEEELVLLKERYAQSCEDKVILQRDLVKLNQQYNMLRDNISNKYFWYIVPVVIAVLYLFVSLWIS